MNRIYIILIATVLFGCGSRKKAIDAIDMSQVYAPLADTLKIDNRKEVLEALVATDLEFNTLIIKGKAQLNLDGKVNDVNVNLRIQKDQKIWMSVSAIIGEVARILVTPDSIQILNRLETTYTKKPFEYIYEFTNDQLDFSVLQAILVGNTITGLLTNQTSLTANASNYMLNGESEGLAYKLVYNAIKKLEEANLTDAKKNQSLLVKYGNFTVVNGMTSPQLLNLNSNTGSKLIGLNLEISSIEHNVPVEFPFTVGTRFKVVN